MIAVPAILSVLRPLLASRLAWEILGALALMAMAHHAGAHGQKVKQEVAHERFLREKAEDDARISVDAAKRAAAAAAAQDAEQQTLERQVRDAERNDKGGCVLGADGARRLRELGRGKR